MRTRWLLVLIVAAFGLAGCGNSNAVGEKVDAKVVKEADDKVNDEETASNSRKKAKK